MQHPYHARRLPPELTAEALAEPAEAAGFIDLSQSNPTRCNFAYPALPELVVDPLSQPYGAQALGPKESREAVAAYLTAAGRGTQASQVMLTASTSEALSYLFKMALNPGERVAGAEPGYPLVPHLAELEGLVPSTYAYVRDGAGAWRLDLDTVATALADGARAVVFVSPHNPTGACLSAAELAALAELCNRHEALAIFDEVFAPYHHTPPQHRLLDVAAFDRAVSLGGLSKAGLMPQAKVSWIAVHGAAAFRAAALAGLEWIGDAYLSLGPVQHAVPALMPCLPAMQRQALARVAANRRALAALLAASGVATMDAAAAGWYALVRPRLDGAMATIVQDGGLSLAHALRRSHGVNLHAGYLYDLGPAPIWVVCLIGPEDHQREGWARVVAFLQGMRQT